MSHTISPTAGIGASTGMAAFFSSESFRTYAEPLDPWEREKWIDVFRLHNHRLFDLLGFEIPEWS